MKLDLQQFDKVLTDARFINTDDDRVLALIGAALEMYGGLTETQSILMDALGGRDGVPEEANVVHMAYAVRTQIGGLRGGIQAASRLHKKWAAQLDAAMADRSFPAVLAVRNRIRPPEE